jgi:hypothetical protein
MPKTRQKTRGIGKRFPTQRKTERKPKPEAKTVEQLQAEITALVDTAEQLMMKQPRQSFRLNNPYDFVPLDNAKREYSRLSWELERLMSDGQQPSYGDGETSKADQWREATFTDPKGAVPRWSRRGSFILWMDYLPMLITWDGIFQPDMTATAVDPKQSFIRDPQTTGRPSEVERARALPSAGYLGLGCWQTITPKMNSVLDLVVSMIAEKSSNLMVRPMTEPAKQNVRDMLAAEPWIAEALKRTPEHRLPMPRHLAAIQQTLFG